MIFSNSGNFAIFLFINVVSNFECEALITFRTVQKYLKKITAIRNSKISVRLVLPHYEISCFGFTPQLLKVKGRSKSIFVKNKISIKKFIAPSFPNNVSSKVLCICHKRCLIHYDILISNPFLYFVQRRQLRRKV